MKEKKITDLMLIKDFTKGSLEAFEELISRYETKVFNLAMRFTRNQEDAEEVVQDVFTTLYKKIQGFQGKSAFSSWLYRIVVNAAFMKLRKRRQYNAVYIEDLVQEQKIDHDSMFICRSDAITINREVREMLVSAINRLPEQYRNVFVLRDIDGLSNEEVSELLSLSIPAVKSRLHRSRLMLRRKLTRLYRDLYGSLPEMTSEDEDEDLAYGSAQACSI
ncbi:MAG: sigma-70 family RNA polymerase sigma factor [SAR324 cluster bacterium]|uniref:Sigma-70 family RNA polymerase sigma factor n=1 Tax=SAR324 cluster bacterium TaxID=2024889 RepID=A0A7X9IKC4_9DELT|nr:sigma-70 family RNA polymerase sigma factor [SAR324 cluster bacterium]